MTGDPFNDGVRQTLAIIEDHWPEIGVDQSDSTWLECICGWDSTIKGSVDWSQHLDNAVDEAIGIEARMADAGSRGVMLTTLGDKHLAKEARASENQGVQPTKTRRSAR